MKTGLKLAVGIFSLNGVGGMLKVARMAPALPGRMQQRTRDALAVTNHSRAQHLKAYSGAEEEYGYDDDDDGFGISNIAGQRSASKKDSESNIVREKFAQKRRDASAEAAELENEEEDDYGLSIKRGASRSATTTPFAAMDAISGLQRELLVGPEILSNEEQVSKALQIDRMRAAGASNEQIAAYMGGTTSNSMAESRALVTALESGGYNAELAKIDERIESFGKVPSHTLTELDADGEPLLDRFVYVDEYTCIGCTHCAHTAPSTFFLEEEHGRARVFQQGGNPAAEIQEAIETCPVDCIHYVDFDELIRLENEREGITINFKARLVGGSDRPNTLGQQSISGNSGARCDNCPTRGCADCPMYGVGLNPKYLDRKAKLEKKRKRKQEVERQEMMRASDSAADL